MKNSDIYAITASDSTASIGDYWSSGHSIVILDTSQGGQNSIEVLASTSDSSLIQAQFKRKLSTGDSKDTEIVPNQVSSIIWAYVDGVPGITYHNNNNCNSHSDKGTLTWSTSRSSSLSTESSDKDSKSHGIAMTIAWGALAPVGIFVARYFRTRSWANKVHIIFLMACSLITIISSSDQFNDNEHPYEFYNDEKLMHSRMGLALTSLVIAQTCFGFFTLIAKICSRNTRLTRLFIRAHKLVGYSMCIAGLINLYSGWDNYEENKELMAIIYTVVLVAFVSLEIYQRFFKERLRGFYDRLEVMDYFEVAEEARKGKKMVFADELVIDVSRFYAVHAGGSFMILETISEDVGKYMAGCRSIGEEFNTYTHSQKAFSMLSDLAIGRVVPPSGYLDGPLSMKYEFMEFTLEAKLEVNQHTIVFVLTHSEFSVNNEGREISWLGKHFIVIYEEDRNLVKRYYPNLLSDTRELLLSQKENSNLDFKTESEKSIKIVINLSDNEHNNQYFTKIETGKVLKIKGPLGPGLLLKSFQGKYLSIVNDTGLIPFIDLIDIALKELGNSNTQFKLMLYVLFSTEAHEFALNFLKSASENCDWLDMYIETGDYANCEIPEKIRKNVEPQINFAWINGSSGFNRFYHEILKNCGISKDKIRII